MKLDDEDGKLVKRVEQMPDGRTITYYTFVKEQA